MSGAGTWEELATAMAHMARDLLAQRSLQEVLERVSEHTVGLVDGCEAAGILVVRDGRVTTMTATDNVVRVSDRFQGELREGPCFDAAVFNHEVYRKIDQPITRRE